MAYSDAWQQYYNKLQDQYIAGDARAQESMGLLKHFDTHGRRGNTGAASYYGWDWDQDERYRQLMDSERQGMAVLDRITAALGNSPQGVPVSSSSNGWRWRQGDPVAEAAFDQHNRIKQAIAEMRNKRWSDYEAYANAYSPSATNQPAQNQPSPLKQGAAAPVQPRAYAGWKASPKRKQGW